MSSSDHTRLFVGLLLNSVQEVLLAVISCQVQAAVAALIIITWNKICKILNLSSTLTRWCNFVRGGSEMVDCQSFKPPKIRIYMRLSEACRLYAFRGQHVLLVKVKI